jgi:hypothetical protein
MEPQGLSAMSVEAPAEVMESPVGGAGQEMVQQGSAGVSVEQVVEALMQGVSPEELVKAGVPEELIDQAIEIIKQKYMAGGQDMEPQPAPNAASGAGLSAMGMGA